MTERECVCCGDNCLNGRLTCDGCECPMCESCWEEDPKCDHCHASDFWADDEDEL